jgi:catechol 2,3-dioxygenase-like lactoylglutathione lyase family enzyme
VRVTGLNHVSISSIDVEASVRFYVDVRATLYHLRDPS